MLFSLKMYGSLDQVTKTYDKCEEHSFDQKLFGLMINETVLFKNRILRNGRLLLAAGLKNPIADRLAIALYREPVSEQSNTKKMNLFQNWFTI